MRIWDISPAYLNRQSLLGEHRELHGIVSIIVNGKRGYSRHPETMRWAGYGWALGMRHRQLACEMALRGYADRSPVDIRSREGEWPDTFIDPPGTQFFLLRQKYAGRDEGRIPLPVNTQQLWAQHKYSVLARSPERYQRIGQEVARARLEFDDLALQLTGILRERPSEGGIRNAVQHMWGYVSDGADSAGADIQSWSLARLLSETQKAAMERRMSYLVRSTALSELMVWL